MNAQLGISLGMEVSQVEKAMDENPDAVAVLVNNPTYYGICSDLRTIVKKAHARGMKVLADELMEPIFISAETFLYPEWRQVLTWRQFPCTNPAEV